VNLHDLWFSGCLVQGGSMRRPAVESCGPYIVPCSVLWAGRLPGWLDEVMAGWPDGWMAGGGGGHHRYNLACLTSKWVGRFGNGLCKAQA
jgi:hypothetical protein